MFVKKVMATKVKRTALQTAAQKGVFLHACVITFFPINLCNRSRYFNHPVLYWYLTEMHVAKILAVY
jgi:hypothetical protein